jgi:hypothetical protein
MIDHEFAAARDGHAIPGLEFQAGLDDNDLGSADDLLDDHTVHRLFEVTDRSSRSCGSDFMHASLDVAQRFKLAGGELRFSSTEHSFVVSRGLGEVNAKQSRSDAGGEEDHREGSEEVGDGVTNANVGGHARDVFLGERLRSQRVARSSDHGGLGGSARQDAGGCALIEVESQGHGPHCDDYNDGRSNRQVHLFQGGFTQAADKLGADHVAEGIDEKSESQGLDFAGDGDAHLAESNRDQQCGCHRPEHECANAKLAKKIAQRQSQGNRGQRSRGEKSMHPSDHCFLRPKPGPEQ